MVVLEMVVGLEMVGAVLLPKLWACLYYVVSHFNFCACERGPRLQAYTSVLQLTPDSNLLVTGEQAAYK